MHNDSKLPGLVDVTEPHDMPAGAFSTWLRRTRSARLNDSGADVPCGECTACCTSAYFIHIAPEEVETLARIPQQLLFPAPGQPKGNVLMGYDKNGHCPMLINNRCSIYEHRPQTCRTYDCRIFPAAGIAVSEPEKALIAQRAAQWKFEYPTQRDRNEHAAVRAAAKFLHERRECFPNGIPKHSTQLAVLAIEVYEVFLELHANAAASAGTPTDLEIANAVIEAKRKLEAKRHPLQTPIDDRLG
jgi:Fe-S-cluster containining protein